MGAKFRGFCCRNWFSLLWNLGWFHKLFTSLVSFLGISHLFTRCPPHPREAEGLPCPVS